MSENDKKESESQSKPSGSESELKDLLFDFAGELNEEAKDNMKSCHIELKKGDTDSAIGLSVIAGVLNGISSSLLKACAKTGK